MFYLFYFILTKYNKKIIKGKFFSKLLFFWGKFVIFMGDIKIKQ